MSVGQIVNLLKMKVRIVPAMEVGKNYMYLLIDQASKTAAAIDPVVPNKIEEAAAEEKVKITHLLTTHHHADHSAGNERMSKLFPGLEIVGGDDRIPAMTKKVGNGDIFNLGNLKVTCLHTPCHTKGHICYFVSSDSSVEKGENVVFTGDTLFSGGCGHFFEGTPDQMYRALIEVLGSLPDETKVFVGHEYTVNNLKYAAHVEPNNKKIAEKLLWAQKLQAEDKFTMPSSIGEEKLINPFMRVREERLKKYTNETDPIKVMGKLRQMKNEFKL
ncbi:DgyrCDS12537 [Dimorphilus gyrociliatus]|uniref:hydroxyacylglutathione hydrolase n=1 Tax=Dimorphilus gyrociliatus TaxID=2664684 RepID=A0A7I8W6S4_9ANNE|nr:DgyrCDS12537 [Dimorphilus gyrociliatus]